MKSYEHEVIQRSAQFTTGLEVTRCQLTSRVGQTFLIDRK